jgi:hypothetical protein
MKERFGSLPDVDELQRLLDDARAAERSEARGQERSLRHVAEESARLAGTLVDLAERGSGVTVRTATGRSHHGPVRLVATDFCVVGSESGDVWIALAAVTTVRPHPGERHVAATGSRPTVDLLLLEALSRVAPERPRLSIVLSGGESVVGQLRSVGTDLLTVRLDGDGRGVCYVSGSSVREVFLSG